MNIHINESQYLELKKATLVSITMGSSLYGCSTESSDKDILHIFAAPENMAHSFVWSHHNLQYKESGVDHVFTTLQNFVRNILTGDSTVNFECLFSEELANSDLKFLHDIRYQFRGYALMRAYLGFARRDLNGFKRSGEPKKLFHAIRGIWSYKRLRAGEYSNDINVVDPGEYEMMMKAKRGQVNGKYISTIVNLLSEQCDLLRKELTKDFDLKRLDRLMDVQQMKALDLEILEFCQTKAYRSKVLPEITIDEIYSALEFDIKYE
jgi:predicted nucleotidyltransferase